MKKIDVAIIGGGPAGYAAAMRAVHYGLSVALFERQQLGGACYDSGAVPSKILIEKTKGMLQLERLRQWGYDIGPASLSFEAAMNTVRQERAALIDELHEAIMRNDIEYVPHEAFANTNLTVAAGAELYNATDIVVATGSTPFVPPVAGADGPGIHTTDTFFELSTRPEKLVIIGAGIIATELAHALALIGTDVTLLNRGRDILQTEEPSARPLIEQRLRQAGVNIVMNVDVERFEDGIAHTTKGPFPYSEVLFATGRKANIQCVEALELQLTTAKTLAVTSTMATSQPHVYAAGDVAGGMQLAHVATAEGIQAIEAIVGNRPAPIKPHVIPRCVYTAPEIASVGILEHEAMEQTTIVMIPLLANAKFHMESNQRGFMKLICAMDRETILGACIVCDGATELISIMSVLMAEGTTVSDMTSLIFPHPTKSEALGELARMMQGKGLYFNDDVSVSNV